MNQKLLSNLPFRAFAQTRHSLLIETPVGRFFLVGDNWRPKILPDDEAATEKTPILRAREYIKLVLRLKNTTLSTRLHVLNKVLKITKTFDGRIIGL